MSGPSTNAPGWSASSRPWTGEKTRLLDAYQAEVIELTELAERRARLTEQGQQLRARVQEIEAATAGPSRGAALVRRRGRLLCQYPATPWWPLF